MRAFSWQYFTLTGDVDAYLLYKDSENERLPDAEEEQTEQPDEADYRV